MTAIGRTWELWAHRYASGLLRNVGARRWVEIHQLDHPIVPVLVEEVLGDLCAPEVTHYAWEDLKRPREAPSMVQIRAGADPANPTRALMLLDMCFPYGVKAAVERGDGKILALRITERVEDSMTKGSWIHDDVSRHFGSCAQCKEVNPEEVRTQQEPALRRTVPKATLAAMCPTGRGIYQAYLRWLGEPD